MQILDHQIFSGFVKENYSILGISKRSLFRRVQLYNAIDNKIFDEKTIKSFRNEKISYSQLLNKLRKLENKRKIRNHLETSKTFQVKSLSSPSREKKKELEITVPNNLPHKVKQVEMSKKTMRETIDKYKSAIDVYFNKINKDISLPAKIQEKKYIKPNNTIGADRIDGKKSLLLENLPIIKSDTREILFECPHCKKGLIFSEDSSKIGGFPNLMPINLEKL